MKKAYMISYTMGCMVALVFTLLVAKETNTQAMVAILPFIALFILLFAFDNSYRSFKILEISIIAYSILTFIYVVFLSFNSVVLDAFSFTNIIYFVLNLWFAIKSPKVKQNSVFGIRNPMTLDHIEVWEKTHKFFSISEVLILPLNFMFIFLLSGWTRFWGGTVLVLVPLCSSSVYSGVIGRKYEKQVDEERKKQEEKESGLYPWKK